MDPITVDVPARVPTVPAIKPEPPKPDPAKADPAKPPFPTPAPAAESKSLLGKVAHSLGLQPTRRQTMIAGAAAVSLFAGVALVRLIIPEKKPDPAGQPLVAEASKGGTGSTPHAAETPQHTRETEPPAPEVPKPVASASSPPAVTVVLPVIPSLPPTLPKHREPKNNLPPDPPAVPVLPTLPVQPSALPDKPKPPPVASIVPLVGADGFGPPRSKTIALAVTGGVLMPVLLGDPAVPAASSKSGESNTSTTVPPPVSLVPSLGPPSVVPAGATEPAKPAAPVTPLPGGPMAPPTTPTGSGTPTIPPPALPALPDDKPVSPPVKPADLPAVPPASVVPPIAGSTPRVPAVPPVVPPVVPPATGGAKPPTDKSADGKKPGVTPSGISLPAPGGVSPAASPGGPPTPASSPPVVPGGLPAAPPMMLDFTKTAGATDPKPAAGPERATTTSYDVDLHEPKSGDTYETISREFYNDPKYAPALREYNGRRPLQASVRVEVPPIHILKTRYPQLVGPVVPAGRTADGWGPAGSGGDVAPAFRPTGARTYTVPAGGMRMPDIARAALGNPSRWKDIYNLNPQLPTDEVLPAGTLVKLPAN